MVVGERLAQLREMKKLSQGEIEKRTGLLRCYISRVENGHTVPSVETLEKMARAMEIPLYRIFLEDNLEPDKSARKLLRNGPEITDTPEVEKLRKLLPKISERHRAVLLKLGHAFNREHRGANGREGRENA